MEQITLSIDTCGSDFNTELGVYTLSAEGDLELEALDSNSGLCPGPSIQSSVVFTFEAGVEYFIVVVRRVE